MMTVRRFLYTLRQDVRFQFRHGFYYAYLFVSVLYAAILFYTPESQRETIASLIVFSDPSTLGSFFIGGIVLLERRQHLLDYVKVTPLGVDVYLGSKIASLAFLSLASSCLIKGAVFGPDIRWLPLAAGVVLTSFLFTLLGLALAVRVSSMNQYLLLLPPVILLFYLPVLTLLPPGDIPLTDTPLFRLNAGHASLMLISGAFRGRTAAEWTYALSILTVWIIPVWLWARHSFIREIMLLKGGDRW